MRSLEKGGQNINGGAWRPRPGLTSPEIFTDYDQTHELSTLCHQLCDERSLPPSSSAACWQLDAPLPIELTVHVRTESARVIDRTDQLAALRFAARKLDELGRLDALHPGTHWWLAHNDLVIHVHDSSSRRRARAVQRSSVPARLVQLDRQLAAPAAFGGRTWSATESVAVSTPPPRLPRTNHRRRRHRAITTVPQQATDDAPAALPPPSPPSDTSPPPSTLLLSRTTPRCEAGRVFGLQGSTRRPRRWARRDRNAQRLDIRRELRRSLVRCIAMPSCALQQLLSHSPAALAFRPRLVAACILCLDVHRWIASAPTTAPPAPTEVARARTAAAAAAVTARAARGDAREAALTLLHTASVAAAAVAARASIEATASRRQHDATLAALRSHMDPLTTALASLHASHLATQLRTEIRLVASVPVAHDDARVCARGQRKVAGSGSCQQSRYIRCPSASHDLSSYPHPHPRHHPRLSVHLHLRQSLPVRLRLR